MNNPEQELMGKMRIAHTTVQTARDCAREVYEDTDAMISPLKVDEMVRILSDLKVFLVEIEPIAKEFQDLATRRRTRT